MSSKKSKITSRRKAGIQVLPSLKEVLQHAEGRSEFAIVVFADIRGFSKFSKMHESPDIAMLIKRFYLKLIDEYFVRARFYKPTGDGLLIVYPYNEKTLFAVATEVIDATFRCLEEFPAMLSADPMINFTPPENLGFGVARGTACCLHAGNTIIDYSGHLVNLAARLMELARPSGIVIDGSFGSQLLPQSRLDSFAKQEVYIRSIAETAPVAILYSKTSVRISTIATIPIQDKPWRTHKYSFTKAELGKLGKFFLIALPSSVDPSEPVAVKLRHPMMHKGKLQVGYSTSRAFTDFTLVKGSETGRVRVDLHAALAILEKEKVPRTRTITFQIDYVSSS